MDYKILCLEVVEGVEEATGIKVEDDDISYLVSLCNQMDVTMFVGMGDNQKRFAVMVVVATFFALKADERLA